MKQVSVCGFLLTSAELGYTFWLLVLRQPYNLMEIHYLPPYVPSPDEVADPSLYARNVREVIARDLGVHTTDHCFDDVLLLIEVRNACIPHIFPIQHASSAYPRWRSRICNSPKPRSL